MKLLNLSQIHKLWHRKGRLTLYFIRLPRLKTSFIINHCHYYCLPEDNKYPPAPIIFFPAQSANPAQLWLTYDQVCCHSIQTQQIRHNRLSEWHCNLKYKVLYHVYPPQISNKKQKINQQHINDQKT